MAKKLLIISTFYFAAVLLQALVSCVDCGPFPDKFKVLSLGAHVFEATLRPQNRVVLGDIQNNTVIFNKYAINVLSDIENYFSSLTFLSEPVFGCEPPPAVTDDKITDIVITTTIDFNSANVAGANLASLFDVVVTDYFHDDTRTSLPGFIATQPKVPVNMTLLLVQAPDADAEFAFTVKYYLDGEVIDFYEFTTAKVTIKK